ncbi:MAG: AMP-binding protein [Actinomycetota bacterium]|nr:AMP-binding protein [Actinomycetota bacterium]
MASRGRSGFADVVVGLTRLVGGIAQPGRVGPRGVAGMARAIGRHGLTTATIGAIAAARDPQAIALVDEEGVITTGELDAHVNAFAHELLTGGVRQGRHVGVLCRNGRGFVIGALAVSRLGADLVLLNNEFAAPALRHALEHELVDAVVHDDEFAGRMDEALFAGRRFTVVAGHGSPAPVRAGKRLPRASRPGRLVVLTSGTTGQAKGAQQGDVKIGQIVPITSLVRVLKVRPGAPMLVLPPMFHGYGFGFLVLGLALGTPIVTTRRFDATTAGALAERHAVDTIVAVPPMLSAITRAMPADIELPNLRAVISGSGQLHPSVSEEVMGRFGPVLFNMYGSTEEGWSTIATPDDLAVAPGTIGRPVAGVRIELLDDEDEPVHDGEVGHVCVSSTLSFGGYTGGGQRARRRGMLDSGDLGHRDHRGLLFIDGRADGMVVTGGENVFLAEVEDVLLAHPAVADARVDGVPDRDYGRRLEATVVLAAHGTGEAGAPTPDVEALKAHVASRLARYKVPRRITFTDELAHTATGKHIRLRHEPPDE